MEQPICKVLIVAPLGAKSRKGLDEKMDRVNTYQNGLTIPGYAVQTSWEGIDHVRVSEMGKTPEWIRISEKNGTSHLVSISYIESQTDVWVRLATLIATAVQQIALANLEIAKAIRDK